MFGQTVKKQVALVNNSPLDLTFTLCLNTDTPLDLKVGNPHTMRIRGLHIRASLYSFAFSFLHSPLLSFSTPPLQDLSFSPASELKLRAGGGSCNVAIQFSPRQHIRPFKAELQAEIAGLLHPLLTVQGCCQVTCEAHLLLFYELIHAFASLGQH